MFICNDALKDFAAAAAAIVGEINVKTADEISADFTHDESGTGITAMPEIVVEVDSTERLSSIIQLCYENGVPMTFRGAGTGKAGGSIPLEGGAVISFRNMNRIISIDTISKTIVVQPGVLLQDIKSEAEHNGLFYPPDPGEKTATIGGNVATNASGANALKYGETKSYVLRVKAVTAHGEIVEIDDPKSLDQLVGSEGTYVAFAEITLKLVVKPEFDVILLLPFADDDTCFAAAAKIAETDYDAAMLEYIDTNLVEFSGKITGNPVFPVEISGERVESTIMLTLEGKSDEDLDECMESIAELSEELECMDILVVDSPTMKREVASAYAAFHSSIESGAKYHSEINVTVPPVSVRELISFAKSTCEKYYLSVFTHAHVASGGVHIFATSDDDSFSTSFISFNEEVLRKCIDVGGDICGEYGIGCTKLEQYKSILDKTKYRTLLDVKDVYDPKHLLNPGKVVK